MTNQTLNKTLVALLGATLLSLSLSALAQPEPRMERLAEELELTEEQRQALQQLNDEQREQMQAIAEERRNATAEQRAASREQMQQMADQRQQRLGEILTSEQMSQLEEMRARAREQREVRMERMREQRPGMRPGGANRPAPPARGG